MRISDWSSDVCASDLTLLRQMVALAGSVAAAEALIAGIAATPAAASISKTDDPRLKTGRQTYTLGESRRLDVYTAEPVAGMARNRAAVIVIHENRGLTPHIPDVARPVALAGFFAVAPDLLTDPGGPPPHDVIGRAQ